MGKIVDVQRATRSVAVSNLEATDGLDEIFHTRESVVRAYSRAFPVVFASAAGESISAADGRQYLDFLSGAGSMNYGHNPDFIKRALIDYLERDGLTNGLDLATTAKRDLLELFEQAILAPRGLNYRVQFCSPSGTNAVEAALKLARLATGRETIVAFHGAFHGVSAGSLAVTGSTFHRQGVTPPPAVVHVPYPESPWGQFDSLGLLQRLAADPSSGTSLPAAVILETIQAEGGVYIAPTEFLIGLRRWCTEQGVLLIVDDVQAGCGRTGPFFSFERAGIEPDLIALSKSISGYGLPMALLLVRPGIDVWRPGQHNGTFRGNQLAFVAAAAAIRRYWRGGPDGGLVTDVRRKAKLVADYLEQRVRTRFGIPVRGMGLIWGVDLGGSGIPASRVSRLCFARGLVVEVCGRHDEVVKLLPPLTIGDAALVRGLDLLVSALAEASSHDPRPVVDGRAG